MADNALGFQFVADRHQERFMSQRQSANRTVLERNRTYREELYPQTGCPAKRGMAELDDAGKRMPFLDKACSI